MTWSLKSKLCFRTCCHIVTGSWENARFWFQIFAGMAHAAFEECYTVEELAHKVKQAANEVGMDVEIAYYDNPRSPITTIHAPNATSIITIRIGSI